MSTRDFSKRKTKTSKRGIKFSKGKHSYIPSLYLTPPILPFPPPPF